MDDLGLERAGLGMDFVNAGNAVRLGGHTVVHVLFLRPGLLEHAADSNSTILRPPSRQAVNAVKRDFGQAPVISKPTR